MSLLGMQNNPQIKYSIRVKTAIEWWVWRHWVVKLLFGNKTKQEDQVALGRSPDRLT